MMDAFTEFGVYTSIIGAILFALGFLFVTALNYTAENQVRFNRVLHYTPLISPLSDGGKLSDDWWSRSSCAI